MSAIDLALRPAIVLVACQLACAWVHTFHAPWPLADAFELAPTVEDQLFKSLGVRFGHFCLSAGRLCGASAASDLLCSEGCYGRRRIREVHPLGSLSAP